MKVHEVYKVEGVTERYLKDGFLCGLECEIESLRHYEHINSGFWKTVPDGSLRNSGMEFLSTPSDISTVVPEFAALHAKMVYRSAKEKFSTRTSTHVHINCLNMQLDAVKQLVLLYSLFEDFYFDMCSPDRKANIHCVPLTQTMLPSRYHHDMDTLVACWSKYSALNVMPLRKLGTVEFRHLEGTDNPQQLQEWLQVLKNTQDLAKTAPINVSNLKKWDNIEQWFAQIFNHVPKIMKQGKLLESKVEDTLINVKMAF